MRFQGYLSVFQLRNSWTECPFHTDISLHQRRAWLPPHTSSFVIRPLNPCPVNEQQALWPWREVEKEREKQGSTLSLLPSAWHPIATKQMLQWQQTGRFHADMGERERKLTVSSSSARTQHAKSYDWLTFPTEERRWSPPRSYRESLHCRGWARKEEAAGSLEHIAQLP